MVEMDETEPNYLQIRFITRRLSLREAVWLLFERRLVVTFKVYVPWLDDHTAERMTTDITWETRVSVPASDFELN